jgi:hypothetical protein
MTLEVGGPAKEDIKSWWTTESCEFLKVGGPRDNFLYDQVDCIILIVMHCAQRDATMWLTVRVLKMFSRNLKVRLMPEINQGCNNFD